MRRAGAAFMQFGLYLLFALFIGRYATAPPYQYADAGMATVKVSLSHPAERVKPCVPLTAEQIAELARNMRRTESCERARLPIFVEIDIDGDNVVNIEAKASGLWDDGPASVYERFDVAPGMHRVSARLRDSARTDGWDYVQSADVVLEPGRYFTVTFRAETGGFRFR